MDHIRPHLDCLDRELNKLPLACQAEKKTGIKKLYLALGCVLSLFFMLFMNWAGGLIANLIGFVYPAYMSIHAVESKEKADDTLWLIYWIVFAFFSVIEYFSFALLYYFPFYYIIKLAILMWLFLPTTQGALFVYGRLIKPFFGQAGLLNEGASTPAPFSTPFETRKDL